MYYDDWSRRYDVAIHNANKGNAAANAYHNSVCWGKREVIVELNGPTVNRRLDIVDMKKQKAIEVKSGNYFSRTEEIMYEIERNKQAVKDG